MFQDQIKNLQLLAYLCKRVPQLKKKCRGSASNEALNRLNQFTIARAKVIQMAVGVEAFLRAAFDLQEVDDDLVIDFATLVVAYDFLLDELKVAPDKLKTIINLPDASTTGYESILQEAIKQFSVKRSSLWSKIEEACKRVHYGSVALFDTRMVEGDVRKATQLKGGFSYIAMAQLVSSSPSNDLDAWCMDFGFAMQLADDIYDRQEDEKLGLRTLPLMNSLTDSDLAKLQTPFFESITAVGQLNLLYQFGFSDYLKGAAHFFQRPTLYGRWRHSLGQSLVEILAK